MIRRLLGVIVTALVLTACGGPAPTPAAPSYSPHNAADVMFAQMMIPHHEQAVQMSEALLRQQDVDSPVVELATTIKAAQSPEITQMRGWLVAWGEDPSPTMAPMSGDGMMSEAEMAALERASGATARRLYLTGMIAHHRGAVAMAQDELDRGLSLEAKALATSIITSQQAEIEQMQQLLAG